MKLELRGVSKLFDGGPTPVHALRDIDLTVDQGEYVVITGPSGSGKSTLLSIIGCLEKPSAGTYKVGDVDVGALSDIQRSRMRAQTFGFVFQAFHLLPDKTALDNVMLPMTYGTSPKHTRRQRAFLLLERVGLGQRARFRPTQLSGGEQQRVAIARALANDPAVILADEPTGQLDSVHREMILTLLERLWTEGRTLIVVSHDPEIVRRAPRHVVLHDGRIKADTRIRDAASSEV
ncbi:MAG: ABC transporter ATP-binding protein [Limnochordales bacterium]